MATTGDVIEPSRAEAGVAFAARLDIAQIHAQGATNRDNAPGSFLGLPCGIARYDDGLV